LAPEALALEPWGLNPDPRSKPPIAGRAGARFAHRSAADVERNRWGCDIL